MLDRQRFLDELEYLVNIDSGSYVPDGVTHIAEWFAERFAKLGYGATWYDPAPGKLGKSVLCALSEDRNFDLLILCHVDTVFPLGEAEKRPFTIEGDRLRGPGVADMKAGCLFALYALEELGEGLNANIGVFFNGEHEISCPNMRSVIEELSAKSRVVFSTEPARANGAFIKQRKGILRYTVTFEGVSAHAGNNPQDGACAITELAEWIRFFKSLENADKGITVNPGMIKGGTSVNTIPDSAELRVDIRTVTQADSLEVDKKIKAQKSFNPKVGMKMEGGITRPPMYPTEKTEAFCIEAEKIGEKYGIAVAWAFAGGGSDASFSSGMGIPSLCGLGPVGGGFHTEKEFLDISELVPRFEVFRDIVERFSTFRK